MDDNKIDMFIISNSNKFPPASIPDIKQQLAQLEDSQFSLVQATPFKDPTMMLFVAWVGGLFGVDRFMLDDTGLGVAKLLTCGGCYIWWLIDVFSVMDRTREYNYQLLIKSLHGQRFY